MAAMHQMEVPPESEGSQLPSGGGSPSNAARALQVLSSSVEQARGMVSRCKGRAEALKDDELETVFQQLEQIIANISGDLVRLQASALGALESEQEQLANGEASRTPRSSAEGARQKREDGHINSRVVGTGSAAWTPRERSRRSKLQDDLGSAPPRLVDFLQGMYREGHDDGEAAFGSLPEMAEYVEPLYDSFICPLTLQVMVEPVTTETGVTFEKSAIEEHLERCKARSEPMVCPVTKAEMRSTELKPNTSLQSTIEEWMVRNELNRVRIACTALSLGTTPGMLLDAMKELKELSAGRPQNKECMYRIGAVGLLARLVEHRSPQIRAEALLLLCAVVDGDDGKEAFAKTRAIGRAIKLVTSKDSAEKMAALSLLLELSKSGEMVETIGHSPGSILNLTAVKFSNAAADRAASEVAEQILSNLEKHPWNIKLMAENGYLEPLLRHLAQGSEEMQMEMVGYLGELVLRQEMTIQIAGSSLETLIKMVHNGNTMIRKAALDVLVQISSHRPNSRTLVEAGVVAIMIEELFITKIDDEPMSSKQAAAAVVANILDSGLSPDSIEANKEGHKITSHYCLYSFVQMLKSSMPDELNMNIIKILLSLLRNADSFESVLSAFKETEAVATAVEFLNSDLEDLCTAAASVLIMLAGSVGHTIIDKLRKNHGQPEGLLRSCEGVLIAEKHAMSALLLARLPQQNLSFNSALFHCNAIPRVAARLEAIKRAKRSSRHARSYAEGLVGILVRFTYTLYDPEILMSVMDQKVASVLVEVVSGGIGGDEAQRLAAVGLQNLSSHSANLSKPLAPEDQNYSQSRKGVLGKMLTKKKESMAPRVCPVHGGVCGVNSTFCLVEANAVETLLGCTEHENRRVVEAALGTLCTLIDDRVYVAGGVELLADKDAVGHVLRLLRESNAESLWQRCFWMLERFLQHGREAAAREIESDRVLPSALITAFHRGDEPTKKLAGTMLRLLKKAPDQSIVFSASSSTM